ncbi:Outer membrane protein assembly factor BamB [Planctomycetes bacterium LzC2]|uniref:Outer membrane protein assembly factor BamB n=2 Tax=Alienimonas chondri TaxID=2681879 RepID=A0ABX1VJD1_9PLAN|nr:Outer membrane protein assembly factor BamB [Alienimonas chondri]
MIAALLLAPLLAAPADVSESADWPGWLGPNRDGRVHEFAPSADWSQAPTERWRVEVGTGYGSPLVAGERVYLHARQGEEEVLWRLDAATGDTVWRRGWAVPFEAQPGGERHGAGPKASPLLADGRVFTHSITGTVRAWDAETGEPLWSRKPADRFAPGRPNWGASGSPAFDPNTGPHGAVIVHLGNDDAGALTAFDARTGETLWELVGDGASYSSPVVTEIDGVRQVVAWTHEAVLGVDAATGAELWRSSLPHVGGDQNMPTPTIHDGTVIVGAENRGVRALRPTRSANPEAASGWTVEELWHTEAAALDMSTGVICDGLLYGFSHLRSGQLFALDPATGELLWSTRGREGANGTLLSLPPTAGEEEGRVLVLKDDGTLLVLAARGAETEILATHRVAAGQTWAPAAPLPDGLLVKDLDTLRRLSFDRPEDGGTKTERREAGDRRR